MLIRIIILTAVIITYSCQRKIAPNEDLRYLITPNGMQLKFNLYCDQSEISNIDWREYMYWLINNYGISSDEYLSALPDSTVWLKEHPALHYLEDSYLRNRAYDDYPVVGITQKQAEDYSEWRSMIVFKMILVSEGFLDRQVIYEKPTHFSIEGYFKGTCRWIKGEKKAKYYPVFRLPTPEERVLIVNYSDSLNLNYFEKCNSAYCKDCLLGFPLMNSNWYDKIVKTNLPAEPVKTGCAAKKGVPLYHVRGNVSEWLSTPNTAAGGGWKHKKSAIIDQDTFVLFKPDAATGFRNIAEWVEWKN